MHDRTMRRAWVLTILIVLAPAASAAATTKPVDVGLPRAWHKPFWDGTGSDANAFFPTSLTIRAGDSIRFRPNGFHTVHLLARGGRLSPPWIQTSHQVQGAADALGQPFWFNGQPVIANAPGQPPWNFGRRFVYTGRREVRSGYATNTRHSMVVRFPRPGTYTFYCDFHRGMRGTVRVLPRSRRAPDPRVDARRVRRELATALAVARTLKATVPPAGSVDVGVAGAHGTEFYDFVPKLTTVPAGTTLTFRVSPGSMEYHTVAAGPGDPQLEPASLLGTMATAFEQRFADPRATYASEPPGTIADLSPALHGNGFWSTGILDNDPTTTFPSSTSVRFTTPGSYVFSCLIHVYMHATVYVT